MLFSVGSPQETVGPVQELDHDKLLGRFYFVCNSLSCKIVMLKVKYMWDVFDRFMFITIMHTF